MQDDQEKVAMLKIVELFSSPLNQLLVRPDLKSSGILDHPWS